VLPILQKRGNMERRIFPILMMTRRDHKIQVECRLEQKVARLCICADWRMCKLLLKEKNTMEVYVASVLEQLTG
jgi:hypothetical protein